MATATALPTFDRLAALTSDEPEILSCYVRLDPAARFRQRYLVDIKRRARDIERHLEDRQADAGVRAAVASDLARLVAWLGKPGNLPPQAGVAIFAASRLDVFEVIPLARVHRNRLALDRFAALQELVDAREVLGQYLAVVSDRTHARFFTVTASGTEEIEGVFTPATRGGKYRPDREDAPGFGERDYHHRLRTETQRHHHAIAKNIVAQTRLHPFDGIALFGSQEHVTGVSGYLPRALEPLLIGSARMNPTAATADDLGRAVWDLQRRWEGEAEARLLDRIEESVPKGTAVNGAREVLRALARGQVRVLVVPDGQTGAGFRCHDTGRLALTKAECRGEGHPEPVVNLVDAAIDDALRTGVEVQVIDDREVIRRVDGLAALLRYRSG
ncbi:MAG: hypothetical protein ACKVZ0_22685 [Gemmatimonadales bacterium]